MSAEASVLSGIAGRYATALFEFARDRDALDEVAAEFVDLGKMIESSDDLGHLLSSPVIAVNDQGRGMAALIKNAGGSEIIQNFVGVVGQNRRLFALKDIINAFQTLVAEHRGEIVAEITSAQKLNDDQLAKIKSELIDAMKTDVQIETSINESILGGLIVKIGSQMVDSSLRTKIQNLRLTMRGAE